MVTVHQPPLNLDKRYLDLLLPQRIRDLKTTKKLPPLFKSNYSVKARGSHQDLPVVGTPSSANRRGCSQQVVLKADVAGSVFEPANVYKGGVRDRHYKVRGLRG